MCESCSRTETCCTPSICMQIRHIYTRVVLQRCIGSSNPFNGSCVNTVDRVENMIILQAPHPTTLSNYELTGNQHSSQPIAFDPADRKN